MISSGEPFVSLEDIYKVTTEAEIAHYYLGVSNIPCKINSPLRLDRSPSFGLFSPNGSRITWIDFSSGERGGIFDLLGKMWNTSFKETLARIYKDFNKFNGSVKIDSTGHLPMAPRINVGNNDVIMECKVREWRKHDIEYWESYGISLEWLKYANVHPISHKIIIKNGQRYVFGADKYAYAYAEFKDGKTTLKIYQPYNKQGFKWSNKHDRSVISLWTKVPPTGDRVCICSSLKDALCLWSNTGIPALAIQGEGYTISDTAVSELKRRFKNVYILLDNDEAGLKDAEILASKTGFTNIVLPNINGAKDVSDLYLSLQDKEQFQKIMIGLFD
jgi:hypothetical protein